MRRLNGGLRSNIYDYLLKIIIYATNKIQTFFIKILVKSVGFMKGLDFIKVWIRKIETFFKWMKQHLKIKSFFGKSENAVYSQIWIAMITYCLEVLLQLSVGHDGSLLELKRTLENHLFQGLDAFIRSLFRKPTRLSKGRRKCDWEKEFALIESQFDEGEVDHLDDLTYDPLHLN